MIFKHRVSKKWSCKWGQFHGENTFNEAMKYAKRKTVLAHCILRASLFLAGICNGQQPRPYIPIEILTFNPSFFLNLFSHSFSNTTLNLSLSGNVLLVITKVIYFLGGSESLLLCPLDYCCIVVEQ